MRLDDEGRAESMPFDPRGIANMMLDEAERLRRPLTNLALQKLLYFAHGLFLVEQKQGLVTGYFEAWEYGPVHPTAYQAFRGSGSAAIQYRATRLDPKTGERSVIAVPTDAVAAKHIARTMSSYGGMSPGRLVEVSHAKDAPWEYVVNKGRTPLAFGTRITDDVIKDRFKFHKVSVGPWPSVGEPGEDSPPS